MMRAPFKLRHRSDLYCYRPPEKARSVQKQPIIVGFAGYQPLIRAYIGKGLRTDLARLDEGSVPRLIASLKRRGVADSLIQQALAETDRAT
jgi:hypothetical protein